MKCQMKQRGTHRRRSISKVIGGHRKIIHKNKCMRRVGVGVYVVIKVSKEENKKHNYRKSGGRSLRLF